MKVLAKFFFALSIVFGYAGSSAAQQSHADSLKELARKGVAVYGEINVSGVLESDERIIDRAITDYDADVISEILNKKEPSLNYRDVYTNTLLGLDTENQPVSTKAKDWLDNCSNSDNKPKAFKCTISLGFLAILDDNNNLTLDWSLKAVDIANSFDETDEGYWYAQYQSNELLSIAFILDGNIDGAINAGDKLINSASKAKVKFGAYHFINNIAYLARTEIGPEAAIDILKEVLPTLDSVPLEGQEIMYYALGKNYTYVNDFEAANKYYTSLEKIVQRPDIKRAYLANMAFVSSKLNDFDKAKKNAAEAKMLFENKLENSFGLNILLAEKNIAISEGKLSLALEIDEEIDRIDELLQERAISGNRIKLSKSLEIQNEKNRRETDKLQFEAQLAAQDATARRTQLLLSTAALIFLMGLVAFIFRSYRREQDLNAEIQTKNEELKDVNADLNETNKDLRRTFDRLKVAHRQAMAGQDAKQKFIGVVGHELRTPLNPIINLSEVLESRETNPKDKALLKAIKNAGKRLHIIVENMLAISSADADSRVFIEMVDVVYETKMVVEEFIPDMRDRNQELKAEGLFLNVNVYKHPDLKLHQINNKIILRSVVRNLFDNAIKFTRHGDIAVHLLPRKQGPGFRLEVRDTGPGMDKTKIEQFTRPFEQAEMGLGRSHEGAGLGLAVVQKYCEQLGASMEIKSTIGKGTTIIVDFPEPAHEIATGKLKKVA